MALAETAQLLVLLQLRDEMSGAIAKANTQLGGLNRTASGTAAATSKASGGFLNVGKAATTFGGAMGHAQKQIGGLLTGPLGFLGLSAGLFTLGGAFGSSVKKLEDFGAGLEKVQLLTGETALASGALILTFQKYGLGVDQVIKSAGFAEKTLGKLNATTAAGTKVGKSAELQNLELVKAQRQAAGESTKAINKLITEQKARDQITAAKAKQTASLTKLQALDKQYGLSLVDNNGKVVDFSTLLNQLATFYDSNASASTKAYVASQVLGRSYTTLLPILKEGSAGLRQAAADAASLGLASGNTVADIAKFHDQMHEFDNQVNVLQLSIGMALLPTLIDLSKAATTFVSENRGNIVSFFKDAVTWAKGFVAAAQPVVSVIGSLVGAFNKLPDWVKTLAIGTFAVNKASSWLFGMSPVKALAGGLVGSLRGSTPMSPVFVSDVSGGGGGGPSLITNVLKYATPVLAGLTIASLFKSGMFNDLLKQAGLPTNWTDPALNAQSGALPGQAASFIKGASVAQLRSALAATNQGLSYFNAGPITDLLYGQQIADLKQTKDLLEAAIRAQATGGKSPDDRQAINDAVRRGAYAGTMAGAEAGIIHSNLFGKAAAARKATGEKYSGDALRHLLAESQPRMPARAAEIRAEIAALEKSIPGYKRASDVGAIAGVNKRIAALQAELKNLRPMPGKPLGNDAYVLGQAISLALINNLRIHESIPKDRADIASARKNLATLAQLQQRLLAQGDTKAAAKIGADIRSMQAALKSAIDSMSSTLTGALNAVGGILYQGGGRPAKDDIYVAVTLSGASVTKTVTHINASGGNRTLGGNVRMGGP